MDASVISESRRSIIWLRIRDGTGGRLANVEVVMYPLRAISSADGGCPGIGDGC
jgi:hypothetical protein